MASVTAQERADNLAAINAALTQLNSVLAQGGYSADLKGKIVAVGFKLSTERVPTSALTEEAAKTLAESLGLEFYDETGL